MSKFGEELQMIAISFKKQMSQPLCEKITEEIVNKIGLHCIPGLIKYSYPYESKGGKGYTLIQPITESMVAWDIWTDHKGGYLFLISCKRFNPEEVFEILKRYKLKLINCEPMVLRLV
jgi:hypothetical protein